MRYYLFEVLPTPKGGGTLGTFGGCANILAPPLPPFMIVVSRNPRSLCPWWLVCSAHLMIDNVAIIVL